jgi:hypothetical protein
MAREVEQQEIIRFAVGEEFLDLFPDRSRRLVEQRGLFTAHETKVEIGVST